MDGQAAAQNVGCPFTKLASGFNAVSAPPLFDDAKPMLDSF